MAPRQSLATRIVAAFVIMAAIVATLFSVIIVNAIDTIETALVNDALNRQLDFIVDEMEGGEPPRLGPGLALYSTHPARRGILPPWLGGLAPGLHELQHDDEDYHVLVRKADDEYLLLVLDQDAFERREAMLLVAVAGAFLASILAACVLGMLLSRTVIAPVVRLAGQVEHRDQLLPIAPALAPEYAQDEVGRLAAAFDTTLGQLRQALEREQLFTSDVSHELRTPLMVIASSCELLQAQPGLSPAQGAQLGRIARAVSEMRELVETFLGLARAPRERERGMAGSTLLAIAEEQYQRWQPEAAQRGLALELQVSGSDAGTYPAPLLRAVLANLVRNAIHYTDSGFVRIVLRERGFSVEDSGAGIPEAERDAVFRPFARGGTTRGDGIGIGLSLVRRICDREGWRIALLERDGGGCEFRVALESP